MDNKASTTTTILVAIIGVISALITGIFSYKAGVAQGETPIRATQTAEAKQISTNSTADSLVSIQEMQFSAIPYTFGNDADKASSDLYTHNGKAGVDYQLKYFVPDIDNRYAGRYFSFDDSQSLTGFDFIEVTLNFGDDSVSFDMFMKDITRSWNISTVRIGKNANHPNDAWGTQFYY